MMVTGLVVMAVTSVGESLGAEDWRKDSPKKVLEDDSNLKNLLHYVGGCKLYDRIIIWGSCTVELYYFPAFKCTTV